MTMTPSPTETVRAGQGSQPRVGGLRVGIMRVGEHQGRRKARLWINGAGTHLRVDLVEGGSQHVAGHGTLTLDAVHLPSPGRRGEVTLTFLADDA
jgi:hypothetical protein